MFIIFFLRSLIALLKREIEPGDVVSYTHYQTAVKAGRIVEPPAE